ncbi:MAG: hypothetical protein AAF639_29490 [Chloroflexota bacterium]
MFRQSAPRRYPYARLWAGLAADDPASLAHTTHGYILFIALFV